MTLTRRKKERLEAKRLREFDKTLPPRPCSEALEAPSHALQIWIEGEEIVIRYPDCANRSAQSRIRIGDPSFTQKDGAKNAKGLDILIAILRNRETRGSRPIGSFAAPTTHRMSRYLSDLEEQAKIKFLEEKQARQKYLQSLSTEDFLAEIGF